MLLQRHNFPSLLRKVLDTMDTFNSGGSIAKDLHASFQVTGIFSLNKKKVLDKLPSTNTINDK